MRLNRLTFTALATGTILALAGCGSQSPQTKDAAITVGDHTVSKQEFQRWLEANARSLAGSKTGSEAVAPDAPTFTKCVARQRKQATGKTKPNAAALKQVCQQQYDQLKTQTMQFLINNAWTKAEGERLHVKVEKAELAQRVKELRRQLGSTPAAVDAQLKRSGLTAEDINEQAELTVISQKIRQVAFNKPVASPTEGQLREYYSRNKQSFARPATRDLRLVGTASRSEANAALASLKNGSSWAGIYKQYNKKPITTTKDGVLTSVPRRALPPTIDKAAFATATGQYFGPIRTQDGGYVIGRVDKAQSGTTAPPYSKVKSQVRQAWQTTKRQTNADRAAAKLRDYWQAKTTCATDLAVDGCSNVAKPKPAATPATAKPVAPAPAQAPKVK
jgi:foldase protein PrsA